MCFAYCPYGLLSPKVREKGKCRRAVVVISPAVPSLLIRLKTGVVGLLKEAVVLLGATTIDVLAIGIAVRAQKKGINQRTLKKAQLLGRKLIWGT